MNERAIVFGASGALGAGVCETLESEGVEVIRATRNRQVATGWLSTADAHWAEGLEARSINRVIWAQGANAEGSIHDQGVAQLEELFEANVMFIARTLETIINRKALTPEARIVIVSSVWQNTARERKLAYVTTKASLAGLVRALAIDLGPDGISVNAVLPGVVDTPMTREFLTEKQIDNLKNETPTGQLVGIEDVARTCVWLSSPSSSGVNGQFICVDGGWSGARYV